jgi:hypothetical protein
MPFSRRFEASTPDGYGSISRKRPRRFGLSVRLKKLATWLVPASASALLLAGPAAAAPSLGVELERDLAQFPTVSHSDERVDYTMRVKNLAAPVTSVGVGEKLACAGAEPAKNWLPNFAPLPEQFEFEWWRNGAPIPGADSVSYTTSAADAGTPIQCLVYGASTVATSVFASQPAMVIDPQPATEPPKPSDPKVPGSQPTIAGSEVEERTCTPPANWEGSPSYTFQWLRNGIPIPGASTEKYLPKAAPGEADDGVALQCQVVGSNAGGAVVGISYRSVVGLPDNETPGLPPEETPEVLAGALAGTTTLELELPGGTETFAFRVLNPGTSSPPSGWNCQKVGATGTEHAKVICTRPDPLGPQASFPAIEVITHIGADAPDTAIAKATAFGSAPAPASDEESFVLGPPVPFGISLFEAAALNADGTDYTQAGGHPFSAVGNFDFNMKRHLTGERLDDGSNLAEFAPVEHVRQIVTDLPRGFVGNALAVPELCPTVQDVFANTCPPSSRVGGVRLAFSASGEIPEFIYAIEPEFGTPAQFAFKAADGLITLSARLRPDEGYAISLESAPAPILDLLKARATICDYGTKPGANFNGCKEGDEGGANPKPLFGNPTRCGAPPPVAKAHLDSWEHPGALSEGLPDYSDPNWKLYEAANPEVTGCEEVNFEPTADLEPASQQADSPTGLDIEMTMPTNGLEGKNDEGERDPDAISQANLKRARITFPVGMAVNASAGLGLQACSAAQIKLKTNRPIECPEASKIGSVEIETPILQETLRGSVYIAKQGDVDGALIGLYLVFDSKRDGILVKIPSKVVPDPDTGQLVAVVDEILEDPFSAVKIHFKGGPQAALINPPQCGTYEIKSELSPWSAKDPSNPTSEETVTETSTFQVTQGPNGGPCPTNALDPKLSAGTLNSTAGTTSPFVFRLSRDDGTQRFSALNVHTPRGLTAYLKGIPYCPQSTIDAISRAAGTGQAQISNPSCPAASQIGTAIAGAGAGPAPLLVETGKAYLAGPYKGAPLSIVLVAPAVAGPLDLGNVVVQNAIRINPETAQISAVSDSIPTILHGILLDVRDIRVALDRPHFTLNPTSCEPASVGVDVKGENGANATVSDRFQAKDCGKLKFGPDMSLRLIGGTKRGDNPQLRVEVTAGAGEANIGRAAVTVPRSEFLDQSHIKTICTRVQFAADACPKGSVYGHATAFTPLLDYPVSGPVYLRSSNNKLPDLVVALRGPDYQPIEAVVVGRIDSIKGQIRATIENAPDVPISKFVLTQNGGKKGLLVNSREICASKNRATVKLTGQNGKTHNFRPVVKNGKCNQSRKAKRKHRSHRAG